MSSLIWFTDTRNKNATLATKKKNLVNNKICKTRSTASNSCQKVDYFASEGRSKNKINSVDEKKPEGIIYINLNASEG